MWIIPKMSDLIRRTEKRVTQHQQLSIQDLSAREEVGSGVYAQVK